MLLHFPLSASSRFVRLIFGECEAEAELIEEKPWERREDFLVLNPAATLPVLLEGDVPPVCGVWAVSEYLNETRGALLAERGLLPTQAGERAEVRRLTDWFMAKFEDEVTGYLVEEKLAKRERAKRVGNGGEPDSGRLRAARSNIRVHLRYIDHLLHERHWLAGERMSYADLAAAAALSVVDYFGEVPWQEAGEAKDWYARMKSRPAFRPLLADLVRGAVPPQHYANPDF